MKNQIFLITGLHKLYSYKYIFLFLPLGIILNERYRGFGKVVSKMKECTGEVKIVAVLHIYFFLQSFIMEFFAFKVRS